VVKNSVRRFVLAFFIVVSIGALVVGCGAAPDTGGAGSPGSPETTADSTASGGDDGARPPDSTLSYGGETVVGALGTYCWTSASVGRCVDTVGVAVRDDAITAPAGSTLMFLYGGNRLDSLGVTAYRVGRGNHLERSGSGGVLVLDSSGSGRGMIQLPTRRSGNRARVTAELPAGEYVLDAFVTVPQGDVSYGFRVEVE
jgi:hypothetical protein